MRNLILLMLLTVLLDKGIGKCNAKNEEDRDGNARNNRIDKNDEDSDSIEKYFREVTDELSKILAKRIYRDIQLRENNKKAENRQSWIGDLENLDIDSTVQRPPGLWGREADFDNNRAHDSAQISDEKPPGIWAGDAKPPGLWGRDAKPPGLRGRDAKPPGLWGRDAKPPGLWTGDAKPPGLWGRDAKPPGLWGRDAKPPGLWGREAKPPGLWGRDVKPPGLWGRDAKPPGLWGRDAKPPGLWGRDAKPPGLWGRDTKPPGLWGRDAKPPSLWSKDDNVIKSQSEDAKPPGLWGRQVEDGPTKIWGDGFLDAERHIRLLKNDERFNRLEKKVDMEEEVRIAQGPSVTKDTFGELADLLRKRIVKRLHKTDSLNNRRNNNKNNKF
ncbi:LWamide neuropeptides [Hydractinia symbiolongicarpus]|uniref:LWamide neuropeptides n=1 Tax=Hydractinia symbiolongicarpus TaxID=13093 RepID=UPI00254F859E|nr:LWamide neuropeptides [Hydractinia symbiolongicarpus]XP_057295876.1 LWamide neuropeptides [Hydractinia symbiolongicarpus]